jgi:hypothetical protein
MERSAVHTLAIVAERRPGAEVQEPMRAASSGPASPSES